MAAGDIKWFAQALLDLGNKVYDMDGDTFKLAIVTNAIVPTVGTPNPHYGGAGTTNFASSAVATGTSWTGPVTLANVSWSLVSSVPTFRADNPATIAQDASGFTDGRWGIIYDFTDTNNRCVAFVDFGSDRTLVTGPLTIDWSGGTNDILTLTQS